MSADNGYVVRRRMDAYDQREDEQGFVSEYGVTVVRER